MNDLVAVDQQTGELAETSTAAAAALVQARVQARYLMAMQRPRQWNMVRSRMLRECGQHAFAMDAEYSLPRWNGKLRKTIYIQGPSIRFVEAALRAMGNVDVDVSTVFDDASRRVLQVQVTDLETNTSYGDTVVVSKTMERRKLKEGEIPLAVRQNSEGANLYTLPITDSELQQKQGAQVSRRVRTLAERLIPRDLRDEALEACRQKVASGDKSDPAAATKALADAFDRLGVSPAELEAFLGHKLAQVSPEELVELRGIYAGIRQGVATWANVTEERRKAKEAEDEDAQAAEKKTRKDKIQDRAKKSAKKKRS